MNRPRAIALPAGIAAASISRVVCRQARARWPLACPDLTPGRPRRLHRGAGREAVFVQSDDDDRPLAEAIDMWFTTAEQRAAIQAWADLAPEDRWCFLCWQQNRQATAVPYVRPLPAVWIEPDILPIHDAATRALEARAALAMTQIQAGSFRMTVEPKGFGAARRPVSLAELRDLRIGEALAAPIHRERNLWLMASQRGGVVAAMRFAPGSMECVTAIRVQARGMIGGWTQALPWRTGSERIDRSAVADAHTAPAQTLPHGSFERTDLPIALKAIADVGAGRFKSDNEASLFYAADLAGVGTPESKASRLRKRMRERRLEKVGEVGAPKKSKRIQ